MVAGIRTTRIFADGADLDALIEMAADPVVAGFTTNPTLMRQAGQSDYERFARTVLEKVDGRPVSFGVCSAGGNEIAREARVISGWADNVYVKIPVIDPAGGDLTALAGDLSRDGVKVNLTAVFTEHHLDLASRALEGGAASFVSVFAGRIADTGVDPLPTVAAAVSRARECQDQAVIWASPRQVLDLVRADSVGCHYVAMTPDLFRKVDLLGRDLEGFCRETVQMFVDDARASGLSV